MEHEDIDDEPTIIYNPLDGDTDVDALLEAQDERDVLLDVINAPDGVDEMAFARLLREIYDELVARAGLERALPASVAEAATVRSLLAMASGKPVLSSDPLAALLRSAASA